MLKSVKNARGFLADVAFFVVFVAWVAGILNPGVAAWIEQNAYLPPTWIPRILLSFFAYFVLTANYDEFADLESKADTLRVEADRWRQSSSARESRAKLRETLAASILIGTFLMRQHPRTPAESTEWESLVLAWFDIGYKTVESHVGQAEAFVFASHSQRAIAQPTNRDEETKRLESAIACLNRIIDAIPV